MCAKKKSNVPRDARLNRANRLLKAKQWITAYKGKKLVKGYAKHYHVDLLCAIIELRMLGAEVSAEYEAAIRRGIAARLKQKQLKDDCKTQDGYLVDWDDEFSFIAGYTDGGAAYGIRWDETAGSHYKEFGFRKVDLNTPPDQKEWADFYLIDFEPPPEDLVILAYF